MLSLGKELDRDEVRNLMSVIKKEIEVINAKSIEELKEEDEEDEESLVENEYDELSNSFQKKLEGKDYGDYLMDHSTFIYLMGPDGAYLTHFRYGMSAKDMAAAIRKYFWNPADFTVMTPHLVGRMRAAYYALIQGWEFKGS